MSVTALPEDRRPPKARRVAGRLHSTPRTPRPVRPPPFVWPKPAPGDKMPEPRRCLCTCLCAARNGTEDNVVPSQAYLAAAYAARIAYHAAAAKKGTDRRLLLRCTPTNYSHPKGHLPEVTVLPDSGATHSVVERSVLRRIAPNAVITPLQEPLSCGVANSIGWTWWAEIREARPSAIVHLPGGSLEVDLASRLPTYSAEPEPPGPDMRDPEWDLASSIIASHASIIASHAVTLRRDMASSFITAYAVALRRDRNGQAAVDRATRLALRGLREEPRKESLPAPLSARQARLLAQLEAARVRPGLTGRPSPLTTGFAGNNAPGFAGAGTAAHEPLTSPAGALFVVRRRGVGTDTDESPLRRG